MALQRSMRRSKTARFNEIVNILLRNDFWGLLREMLAPAEDPAATKGATAPERLRQILEELGPTFIKLGQLMATRPDLVPAEYVEEFKKLYDGTEPSPYSEVREVVQEQLGKPIEELFATFGEKALASASVGQVHVAHLKDGTKVAVKVQHVGIEDAMIMDFEILRGLVQFIEKTFSASRIWQPTAHLEELKLMMDRELDYRFEVKNTLRAAHSFRHDDTVKIPHMYKELCARRIMVMEFIDGIKFATVDGLEEKGVDRKNVAKIVTHAMAKQIFLDRFFHADPSPGNMMIMHSNQVVFLDWGAVGMVTERRSKAILQLITGIAKGDVESTSEAIIDLCDQFGELDTKRFQTDVEKILDFFEREMVSVADPRIMEMILDLATRHKMLLPPDFMLISRALFQFDGFCRDLDPDYEIVSILEPFVAQLIWKNISSPKKQKELVEETFGELLKFARTFPHALNTLVRKVERNELSTRIELAGLEGIKQAQGRGVLKMAFTVMMAALVVGLGVVYSGPDPTRSVQFLFMAAVIVIAWTLVMILWSESFKGNRE
ncbi:MAG: ABC1 kinase family protein [Thermoplasmatota archaeon]